MDEEHLIFEIPEQIDKHNQVLREKLSNAEAEALAADISFGSEVLVGAAFKNAIIALAKARVDARDALDESVTFYKNHETPLHDLAISEYIDVENQALHERHFNDEVKVSIADEKLKVIVFGGRIAIETAIYTSRVTARKTFDESKDLYDKYKDVLHELASIENDERSLAE